MGTIITVIIDIMMMTISATVGNSCKHANLMGAVTIDNTSGLSPAPFSLTSVDLSDLH